MAQDKSEIEAGSGIDGSMHEHASIPAVRGSFDLIHAGSVTGWAAASKDEVSNPREVEILADGEFVAAGFADLFRQDLFDAGISTGRHAFRVPLPIQLYDGREYQVVVRDRATGIELPGSPKFFHASAAERGTLVLDGSSLAGWARILDLEIPETGLLPIQVVENGDVLTNGEASSDGKRPMTLEFRIPLPTSVFDGRPHLFSIRTRDADMLLGELATIVPYTLTSESSIREYARAGLTASLSPNARHRYTGLVATLRKLSARESESRVRVKEVLDTHRALVRGAHEEDRTYPRLEFPKHDAPRVSVVIPAHNKFHVTYHCLASLLLAANEASFEVILVDDGSEDLTRRAAEFLSGVTIVRNEEALGFIHASNRGAKSACGEYVVMLNNDTEATPGWLDEMLWPFEHFERVGMVGAKLVYPDGRLQEAGGIVWSSGDPWNYGRLANPRDPRFNYTRQTDYLSGACVMLPRALWEEIGGFDEAYVPAYFEDTDLAFKVRERGYKTVYAPFAEVIHYEGASNGTDVASGIKRFQEINRPRFKQRWVRACRNNGKLGIDVELNKDRNVEYRALVLDAETPMPDQAAGAYAAIQEMRMLQALGFKCTFAPHNMAWMAHYTHALQRMGVECIYSPFAASIGEVLEFRGREFDLVYVTRYYVAQHYIDLIRRHAPQAKIVMNNADLHFLREIRAGLEAKSTSLLERATKTREDELATMRQVDLVLSYTDVEKAVIESHNLAATRVARCPWFVELQDQVPGWESRCDIAFLGGFNHLPNVQAVEWFVNEVMPLLRKEMPGTAFRIYGSKIPDSLRNKLAGEVDVFVEGWVPEVADAYNHCRVFVAPLLSGAGIKGKVIGALAHGVPTVMSPIAAEGILVVPGEEAMIAATPTEWVNAIAALYENEKRWQSMSSRSLAFAKSNYGFDQAMRLMQQALEQVGFFGSFPNKALVAKWS